MAFLACCLIELGVETSSCHNKCEDRKIKQVLTNCESFFEQHDIQQHIQQETREQKRTYECKAYMMLDQACLGVYRAGTNGSLAILKCFQNSLDRTFRSWSSYSLVDNGQVCRQDKMLNLQHLGKIHWGNQCTT